MSVLWSIFVGFIVGVIAKVVTPARFKPRGFVLTTALGIVGALVGTWLGQAVHLYGPNEPAGFLGSIVGAVMVLLAWTQIASATQR